VRRARPRLGRGGATAAQVERADVGTLAAEAMRLSQVEIGRLGRDEAEAVVVATERVIAALQARQTLAMETLASRVEDDLGTTHADPHGVVASMLAPALHCATRTVRRRLVADRRLLASAESSFQGLWDGDLERHRADTVAEVAQSLDPALWSRFEALLLETSFDRVTGEVALVSDAVWRLSRSQLARRARAIARSLDPESEERALREARGHRRVVVGPDRHAPGLARWQVHLPTDVSTEVYAAVDALASSYARSRPGTAMDAHRADALADLVRGNAEVRTVVELVVPVLPGAIPPRGSSAQPTVDTALGAPVEITSASRAGRAVTWVLPGGVELPRHGVLAPEAVSEVLSRPDTLLRLARLDPDGSIVQDPAHYRPSASTRRRVRSRDGTCRFPGCNTPASRTDVDHVVAHPDGPTAPPNLLCLCRTHHLFKHHGGWTVELSPDGTARWRAPDGRVWTTEPQSHRIRDDLHLTDEVDPDVAHDLGRGWFPGLPPGMSLADLVGAEREAPEDPPEADAVPHPPVDWQQLDLAGGDPDPPTGGQRPDQPADRQQLDRAATDGQHLRVGPPVSDLSVLESHIASRLALAA
jgi:hypothetical protein